MGEGDLLVVHVVHDVGGAEERVAKDRLIRVAWNDTQGASWRAVGEGEVFERGFSRDDKLADGHVDLRTSRTTERE